MVGEDPRFLDIALQFHARSLPRYVRPIVCSCLSMRTIVGVLHCASGPGTRISGYLATWRKTARSQTNSCVSALPSVVLQVSPIVVDRDDVDITYESMGVQPPAHCNYYFRSLAFPELQHELTACIFNLAVCWLR